MHRTKKREFEQAAAFRDKIKLLRDRLNNASKIFQ
jgi:protein-arginine kinase activator protein McsA